MKIKKLLGFGWSITFEIRRVANPPQRAICKRMLQILQKLINSKANASVNKDSIREKETKDFTWSK